MEKNKLYKVNKWNKPAFMKEGNVFDGFGNSLLNNPNPFGISIASPTARQYIDWSNPFQRAAAIGTSAGLVNGFSSIANATNPFNNSDTATAQPTKWNTLTGILGAVGGTAGNMLGNAIGGGYSTGGVGEGVAGVGNTIGGLVSTVNPLVGTAIQFGSGLIGGAIDRGWGVKENKENIEAIKQNTANARMMGNALAGATDSKGFFDTAGEMTTGSGFSAGDLYKDGWFTSKGTAKGNALINKENNALAYQRHGMVTGAENVDSIMDDNVFSNFAAFGGYVPTIGAGTEDMPAVNFGIWQDWLTGLNKRRKQASDNREANDYTNIGMGMRYDFGGDMQTNSADFPTGLTVPVDNTRVANLGIMPIERKQNFSDSEYFWDAGREYPAGLWRYKDGTFHTTGAYGKDIVLTQEEADSIIRANKAKNRRERLQKAMENHKHAEGGQMSNYAVGQVYDVSGAEANRLKSLGYEFTVVS